MIVEVISGMRMSPRSLLTFNPAQSFWFMLLRITWIALHRHSRHKNFPTSDNAAVSKLEQRFSNRLRSAESRCRAAVSLCVPFWQKSNLYNEHWRTRFILESTYEILRALLHSTIIPTGHTADRSAWSWYKYDDGNTSFPKSFSWEHIAKVSACMLLVPLLTSMISLPFGYHGRNSISNGIGRGCRR